MKYSETQPEELQLLVEDNIFTCCPLDDDTRNQELKILILQQQSNLQNILNIIGKLDNSQLGLEKKAFDAINCSDITLNIIKEGILTMNVVLNKISSDTYMDEEIEKVRSALKKILEAAFRSNDMIRNVEHEIAYQRDITDNTKNSIEVISEIIERTGYYFEEY